MSLNSLCIQYMQMKYLSRRWNVVFRGFLWHFPPQFKFSISTCSHLATNYHARRGDPPDVSIQSGCTIMKSEIDNIIKEMKCGKARGNDNTTTNYQSPGWWMHQEYHIAMQSCSWHRIPSTIHEFIHFVRLPKNAKATDCSHYQTLSIFTTIGDVCIWVFTNMSFSSRAAAIRQRSSPTSRVIFAFVFSWIGDFFEFFWIHIC